MVEKEQPVLGPYRVLDLTDESGVFCTRILAGLGADVIRIEPPAGDPTRRIGPFYHDEPDPEKSLHWFTYNLNKRSITLNIECTTGQELFKRLIKTADFLVECFRPGYLDKLELGYSELSAINPRIIHTSITPFGSTGPYSQFKGSNLICSAASGFMYVCGDADRAPVQITTPVAYLEAGLHAVASTMVAHWYRRRAGKGQHVDVSVQESMVTQILPHSLLWKSHGLIPFRTSWGTSTSGRVPRSTRLECKDGAVVSDTTILRGRQPLREWLASEGLAGDLLDKKWDPVFVEGRKPSAEERDHIDELCQGLARKYTAEEFMTLAQEKKIQAAQVHNVRDIMENRHLKEREYFIKVEHPELNDTIVYAGAPFKSDEMSIRYWRRAPFIGEHNQEVYRGQLGLSQQELVILKEGGVI